MTRLLATLATLAFVAAAQTPRFTYVGAAIPPDFSVIAALDVDTDGDVDLLAREGVLTNDGTGRFAPFATPSNLSSALFYATSVLNPDLDGDGDDDLLAVVLNGGAASTLVAFLAGPGGLVPLPLSLPPNAAQFGALDYDGDGRDDLVVLGPAYLAPPPGVALWRNAGNGVFVPAPSGTLPSVGSASVFFSGLATADLDADGDRDVVLVDPTLGVGAAWFDAGASFSATPFAFAPNSGLVVATAVADLDGDGREDVVWSMSDNAQSRRGVVSAPAAGGVAVSVTNVASRINRLVAFDADGDGLTDLAETTGYGAGTAEQAQIRFGPVVGGVFASSAPAEESVDDVVALDADGDADLDLVYARGSITCGLRLAASDGTLVDAGGVFVVAGFSAGIGAAAVVPSVGDFDADGDADVCVPPGILAPDPTLARNDGRGVFALAGSAPYAANFVASVAADFTGDGRADLLACPPSMGAEAVTLYRSLATGGFLATPIMTVYGCRAAAALDFDLDGDLDAAFAFAWPPRISKFVNVGGTFVFGGDITLPAPANELRVADLDGDGRPDLLAPNGTTVEFVDGATLSAATPLLTGSGLPIAADRVNAADFDGDADLDLLADANVMLNGGSLLFAYHAALAGYPQAAAGPFLPHELLDANGDGDVDVVSYGALWYGGAGAAFSAAEAVPFPAFAVTQTFPMASYRPVDLDRDGDTDLVDPAGRALFNATAQASAGALAAPGRTASVVLRGPPNGVADLFCAPYVFAQPIPLPGIGNLFLTPGSAVYLGQFPLDGTGAFELPLAVPNVPSLVGLALHWQAFLPSPGRLTNALRTPVLPL